MAVTKSWETKVLQPGNKSTAVSRRVGWREFVWLLSSSILVGAGLLLVYSAKTHNFQEASRQLSRGELLDLNRVANTSDLLPFLQVFSADAERQSAAARVFDYVASHRPLANVGALARLRKSGQLRIPLLPLAKLKPAFVVRTPPDFKRQFLLWISVYFVSFYAVFLILRWSGFRGDFSVLPALHLLTGIGLILAVSLRDPLRDTMEFSKVRVGRWPGLHSAFTALSARPRLSAFLLLVLHAVICSVCAFRALAPIRLGTCRQRCKSEPRPLPAGRSHQNLTGVLPGRLLRAKLGALARSSGKAPASALAPLDPFAAFFARSARDAAPSVARSRCFSF